jgi:hypothetical protein
VILRNMSCCGAVEITNLSDSLKGEEAFAEFCKALRGKRFRFVVFTQATDWGRSTYGSNFAAYIQRNGLGEVVRSGAGTNPNSGNYLIMWTWTVNWQAVSKLRAKKGF